MSEVELLLVNEGNNATIYTLQFLSENESEFERFYSKLEILLKEEEKKGTVKVSKSEIITNNIFEL